MTTWQSGKNTEYIELQGPILSRGGSNTEKDL